MFDLIFRIFLIIFTILYLSFFLHCSSTKTVLLSFIHHSILTVQYISYLLRNNPLGTFDFCVSELSIFNFIIILLRKVNKMISLSALFRVRLSFVYSVNFRIFLWNVRVRKIVLFMIHTKYRPKLIKSLKEQISFHWQPRGHRILIYTRNWNYMT